MDSNIISNIKIFNLVEKGHSTRTLKRIFDSCKNFKIDENSVKNAIGDTPTSNSIINDLCAMKGDYYSLYCLINFDVNIFIIERLKEFYSSLEDLAFDFDNLNDKVKLQTQTIDKIKNALVNLNLMLGFDLQSEILHIIKENDVISDKKLKEIILNKYKNVSIFDYDNIIDTLISKKIHIPIF